MTHAADPPDDPGWPSLLPPMRRDDDPASPEAEDQPPDDDELFGDWEPRRRVSWITAALGVAALVVAGFAGGVLVEKRSATASASAGTAGAARSAGAAAGSGAAREGFGGFGGGGSAGGGFGGVSGGGTAGSGTGGGGRTGTAGTPVVVGTVASVAAGQITVTNFAGATVVVRVPAGTPVTTPGLRGLAKGQTVSVEGTRSSNGVITASAVVSRS